MIDKVAYKSKVQNFSESRLTPFTEDEQRMIKGKEQLHVVYQYQITQYGIIWHMQYYIIQYHII